MPFVNVYWIFFSVAIYGSSAQKVSYEGAQVWQTELRGTDDVVFIKRLGDNQVMGARSELRVVKAPETGTSSRCVACQEV